MVPQNNFTPKHNSLTKSSSLRGAHWLLAYGKYEWPPYYSNKPKATEEWRFENSQCGSRAVSKTPSDKVCPFSRFLWTTSEKFKPCNSNPEIANAGAPQTTSTSPPSMCASFPASSSVSPWSPTTKSCSRTPSETLLAYLHKNILLKGTWRLMKMAKLVLAEPTTDSLSASDKMISSCRITLSQIFHGIANFDHQLVGSHTLVIYYFLILVWWICLPAMTSAWYLKEPLRNETNNFLISKLCFPWLVYTLTPSNSTHYYLISSKLPSITETTKKFPAEKKITEFLRMYSVTWQSTLVNLIALINERKSALMFPFISSDWSTCELSTLVISMWNNHRRAERIKERKEDWPWECPFTNRGSVAVYSRGLRAYGKKRTSPDCLKIKRNCIETLDFSISIHIILLQ